MKNNKLKVILLIPILLLIWIIFLATDLILVSQNKQPVFAIKTDTYKDRRAASFYGLGYKVIEYKNLPTDAPGTGKFVLGLWSMKYDKYKALYPATAASASPRNTLPDFRENTDWSKEKSLSLFKEKYYKGKKLSKNIEYEELGYIYAHQYYGSLEGSGIRIVSILPEENTLNEEAVYEIGGYRLTLQKQSQPSVTGIYIILNNTDIYTLDEAINNSEYPISMTDIYPLLPAIFSDEKYTNPDESTINELMSIAKQLLDQNVQAQNIFIHGFLPHDVNNKVISEDFKTYNDLENFIHNTYTSRIADFYLSDLYKGLYYDLNGELFFEPKAVKGRDYQSIWDGFTFEISDFKEYSATITANRKYSQFGTSEIFNRDVTLTMVKENGKWLLTNMQE